MITKIDIWKVACRECFEERGYCVVSRTGVEEYVKLPLNEACRCAILSGAFAAAKEKQTLCADNGGKAWR
jgi:hypothetical protein